MGKNDNDDVWVDYKTESPKWNWGFRDYRVKPVIEYEPYNFKDPSELDFLFDKILVRKTDNSHNKVTRINYNTNNNGFDITINNADYIPYILFNIFMFLDGTPCGQIKNNQDGK